MEGWEFTGAGLDDSSDAGAGRILAAFKGSENEKTM
jgi:hypothetical protein